MLSLNPSKANIFSKFGKISNNNNNNHLYHKRLGTSVKSPNGISTNCIMWCIGTVSHYSPVWIIPPLPLKSILYHLDRVYRGGVSLLTFCIKFLPTLLWRPFQTQGPQESNNDYIQLQFSRSSLFLGGEMVAGFYGVCDKVVLLMKVAL